MLDLWTLEADHGGLAEKRTSKTRGQMSVVDYERKGVFNVCTRGYYYVPIDKYLSW